LKGDEGEGALPVPLPSFPMAKIVPRKALKLEMRAPKRPKPSKR
jgi:hypothetical protein